MFFLAAPLFCEKLDIHQTGHDMNTCLSFHTRLSPRKEAAAHKKEFPHLILALKYRFLKNNLLQILVELFETFVGSVISPLEYL